MNELTNPQTVSFLERAARDPEIDVSKLERIIDLQERQIAREAKRQFDEAMNALQSEMPQVLKDKANPHTRSRYATYEEVDRTIRPYYARHGFSVRFALEMKGDRVRVGCVVSRNGHCETCELESGLDTVGTGGRANKTDVQGTGSIVSYLKRYTIMAAFAVAVQDDETDDDGIRAAAAAAEMTRAARITERAQDYEAPPKSTPSSRREPGWQDFIKALSLALNDAQDWEEVDRILCGERVMKAKAAFKDIALQELNKLIIATLQKWEPKPDDMAGDQDEVLITGEDKVMAG